MFTGIIENIGHIAAIERDTDSARVCIESSRSALEDVKLGASIAVSGPCLTVVAIKDDRFEVDVSVETLACTTLGDLGPGDAVNLEKALRVGDRLGGHLVSGHIDGVGEIIVREDLKDAVRFRVRAPVQLAKYIALKGSICVDGVSLTINAVSGAEFDLMIIPHTLEQTTLGGFARGQRVNLEVDQIARYLERLLSVGAIPADASP